MTKESFDELFRSLHAPLVNYAFRYLKRRDSASDIVQDAFIKLWHQRDSLEHQQSLKAYMYTIVRNLSLNYLRDNARELTDSDLLYKTELAAVTENSEEELKKQRIRLLKRWVLELPERQREAFELSRYEGLDHEEIALVMDVSRKTVNNHIVEALRNLQKLHDEHYQ